MTHEPGPPFLSAEELPAGDALAGQPELGVPGLSADELAALWGLTESELRALVADALRESREASNLTIRVIDAFLREQDEGEVDQQG